MQVFCNSRETIGLELDFYFPELNLAIEINGFLHYKAIFGMEKLTRIQKLDDEKALRCKKAGIDLHIIDVSNEPHLTQNLKSKHWKTVNELIIQAKKSIDSTFDLK